MKRSILIVFMAIVMIFCMATITASASGAGFDGEGTEKNPYKIQTAQDLESLAKGIKTGKLDSKAYYELVSDIDLSGINWMPIGAVKQNQGDFLGGNVFKGTFNGNGHTISNLTINQSNPEYKNYYYGLFGWNSGTIKNVILKKASITTKEVSYIGAIAAVNEGKIRNCKTSGTIKLKTYNRDYSAGDIAGIVGRQVKGGIVYGCRNYIDINKSSQVDVDFAGGIVGYNEDGTIENCVNFGDIYGKESIGGICGVNDGLDSTAKITGCLNVGRIYAKKSFVGGITGQSYRNNVISNCENTGTVDGRKYAGGVAGYMSASNLYVEFDKMAIIENSINVGTVNARENWEGAIAGRTYSNTEESKNYIRNCFFRTTEGKAYNVDSESKSNTTIIKNVKECIDCRKSSKDTFSKLDFKSVWTIGKYYPVLQKFNGLNVYTAPKHTYKTYITKATLKKNGKKKIKCKICGRVKSSSIIYRVKTLSLSSNTYTYNGKKRKPAVTVKNSKGQKLKNDIDYTVSYGSGRKKVGQYEVKVKGKGKYSFSKTLKFKIKPKKTARSRFVARKK